MLGETSSAQSSSTLKKMAAGWQIVSCRQRPHALFAKLTKVNAAVRLTYDAIGTAPLSRV
jgi:hypothetical protein